MRKHWDIWLAIILWFLMCLVATTLVQATSILEYDPDNAIVSSRVIMYRASGDQSTYMATPNCNTCPIANHLINADLSGVSGVPRAHWKYSAGSIVEMSQPEKDNITSVANATAAAADAAAVALVDNTLASAQISDYTLTKIDQSIDNIDSLEEAKTWLKKQARYLVRMLK